MNIITAHLLYNIPVVHAVGRGNEECIDLDLLEWATYTY
jgi:hypothetical protein